MCVGRHLEHGEVREGPGKLSDYAELRSSADDCFQSFTDEVASWKYEECVVRPDDM